MSTENKTANGLSFNKNLCFDVLQKWGHAKLYAIWKKL